MAAIQVCNAWLQSALETLVSGGAADASFEYRLFENDLTPTPDTLLGAFTEVTIAGYAGEVVTATGWAITNPSTGLAQGVKGTVLFTMTGPGTIYGMFVVDGGGALAWSQRFTTPVVLPGFGGTITLQPLLQLNSPI